MGTFFQVDDGKAISVSNVFACGDAAREEVNVTLAGFKAHRGSMGWGEGYRSQENTHEIPINGLNLRR